MSTTAREAFHRESGARPQREPGVSHAPMTASGLDREQVRDRLRQFILGEVMQHPSYPLADDEALISGGLIDSLALALVAVFIESAFGINLPDTDLTPETMDTLEQMVARVMEAGA